MEKRLGDPKSKYDAHFLKDDINVVDAAITVLENWRDDIQREVVCLNEAIMDCQFNDIIPPRGEYKERWLIMTSTDALSNELPDTAQGLEDFIRYATFEIKRNERRSKKLIELRSIANSQLVLRGGNPNAEYSEAVKVS